MKYYYTFKEYTLFGRRLKVFWQACQNVERKADAYAKKMGAEAFYSSPVSFAGGVACLVFPKRKMDDGTERVTANREVWRMDGTLDGEECFVPNVTQRTDCLVYSDRRFCPSDTSSVIFHRRFSTWREVSHLHSLKRWLEKMCLPHTTTADELEAIMQKKHFLLYTEIVAMSGDKQAGKRAIRAERFRMELPVIEVADFYRLFGVADTAIPQAEETPTFFLYQGSYYVGLSAEIDGDDVEEIDEQRFTCMRNMATRKMAFES